MTTIGGDVINWRAKFIALQIFCSSQFYDRNTFYVLFSILDLHSRFNDKEFYGNYNGLRTLCEKACNSERLKEDVQYYINRSTSKEQLSR